MAKIHIVIEDDVNEADHVDIQIFGDFYNEESPAADIARVAFQAMQDAMQDCDTEVINNRTLN